MKQDKTYQILLVDDKAANLQTLFYQLGESGKSYDILLSLGGKQALEIIEAQIPDLIITDWEMPDISGPALIRTLKAKESTRHVPILMVSGMRTKPEDLQEAMQAGAIDFLRKPINKVELWARVENLLKLYEAEKQQREINEKLAALDQFKSRFFTNISHEFRTPLTVIEGMASQIQTNPEKWMTKGIDMISRNTRNLLNLVNQILELRKLEAGELSLNLIQGEIISFLRYITESFHSLAESQNLGISFHAELEELWMDYDPEKILRILTNLLSNAIKFTPKGGAVSVEVSSRNETHLQLIVQDTGIGIPESMVSHIFERFYQVDDSATREAEGTGIGLSLSKELVDLMEGRIEVQSVQEKGTSFTVYLPIRKTAPKANPKHAFSLKNDPTHAPSLAKSGSSTADQSELPSLLIIEDNEDVIDYLASLLEDQYALLFARNGQEGIDTAWEMTPDLIISDVMMPVKDGFEVCDALKNDVRSSHIPIVLLTARADHESRIKGLKRGADAYLHKPFNKEELSVRLDQLLALRKKLQHRYASLQPDEETNDPNFEQEDQFILKIRRIVEEDMGDKNFQVAELCQMIGMSRSNLHKKLTALTGSSTTQFIRRIRLQKARELLKNPLLNISEIAYDVGFSDPKYFTRAFSKEYGFSPSDARKSE